MVANSQYSRHLIVAARGLEDINESSPNENPAVIYFTSLSSVFFANLLSILSF